MNQIYKGSHLLRITPRGSNAEFGELVPASEGKHNDTHVAHVVKAYP
jgi:hypothetical protein